MQLKGNSGKAGYVGPKPGKGSSAEMHFIVFAFDHDNIDETNLCKNTDSSEIKTCKKMLLDSSCATGEIIRTVKGRSNLPKAVPWSNRLDGKEISEGKGKDDECYGFVEAMFKCIEAKDCNGISTDKNVCDGDYRVTHAAKPTLATVAAPAWKTQLLWTYTLDRTKLATYKQLNWFDNLPGFKIEDENNPKSLICFDKLYQAKKACEKNSCLGISQAKNVCNGNYSMAKGNKVKLVGIADWAPEDNRVYLRNNSK